MNYVHFVLSEKEKDQVGLNVPHHGHTTLLTHHRCEVCVNIVDFSGIDVDNRYFVAATEKLFFFI